MRVLVYFILITCAVLLFVAYALHSQMPCGCDEYSDSLAYVESVRGMDSKKDIGVMHIELDTKQSVDLVYPKDAADIRRLLASLRSIRVKHGPGHSHSPDYIAITPQSGPGLLQLYGAFDPNSPVISDTMNSDDLGDIVYDIFRRRGIEPRSEK